MSDCGRTTWTGTLPAHHSPFVAVFFNAAVAPRIRHREGRSIFFPSIERPPRSLNVDVAERSDHRRALRRFGIEGAGLDRPLTRRMVAVADDEERPRNVRLVGT